MSITNLSTDWGTYPRIVRITTTDTLGTITTNGYLQTAAVITAIAGIQNGTFQWTPEDYCLIFYNGGEGFFTVDYTTNYKFTAAATVPGTLSDTLASGNIFVGNAGNVATGVAMTGLVAITNAGVTSVPLASTHLLVGSAGGAAASVALSGDATLANTGALTIAANAVTSAKIALNVIQYVKVPVTAAQFNAAYATPLVMIAAPGANLQIVVKQAVFAMTFVSASYANGGATGLQYDNVAHLAGTLATATVPGATIDAYGASSNVGVAGAVASGLSSATVNKAIYLSNDTAPYITGDSTWEMHLWYSVVTL
jgi:hypothetical protein